MTPVTVYGLGNCDTCKKARNWLARKQIAHEFIDYREHPLDPALLKKWAADAGGWDGIVNRSSTTWRNLPAARKSPGSDAEWILLIRHNPTLVRRPVLLLGDGSIHQGFSDALYSRLFAAAGA